MCPVSVTPTRDEIGARNSAPLRLFNVLSSASSKARSTAVDELCSFHDKHDGEVMSTQLLSERDPALAYTLKRLIRGLASPAKCARQGFAAALTVLLDHFPKRIDTSTLMMCLNDNLNPNHNVGGETRGNAMTKSERKQFMLGKVFAALVLCRANRIHQLDEHYVITLASEIRKLSNADWLSELCAETLAAIVVASKSVSSLRQALTVLLAPLINDTTSRIAPIVSLAFDDDAQRVNVSLKHVVDSLRRVVALRAQPHRTCYHVLAHHQSCFEHIFHSFVHKELLSETRSNAQLCTALHLYEIVVNNQFYTVEHCVSSPQVIEMLHSALTSRIDVLQQCGKRLLNAMIDMCINAVTLIQTLGVDFDETTGSNSLNAIASKLTAEQLYDYTTSLAGELTTQDIERKRHVITALFSLARLHSIDSVSHYKCRIVCIKAMLTCDNEPDLAELCRTHVKTLVRSDAAFIEILNDVENKVKTISFVTFCSASVTARKHMKKAVRQLKEIAESNSSSSTTLPSTICHASRTMLLYLAAFQIWCDEKFVSDLMTELSVACIALTKSSTLSENDIVKHVNVLVDMCLSLLVHDSALLRDACKAVMRLMAEHINAIALEDMLRVVADGYYIEAESTRVDSDDDEDDDDEDDEDNDDDDDDDENDKDDDEGEDNDDDDDDAESDSSASDSNDEQPSIPMDTVDDAKSLQRYDQYLIKYINLRNSIKKEKQDTLLTSLNFCLRVVSLLDIFVRKCKRHILLPTMIVPLLSVIQSSSSSGFNHSLLHTARVKLLQSVVSTIPPSSADDSVCREILSCAATAARRSSVAPLVGSTLLYALKMCNSSNVDKKFVSDLITPLFVDFFSRKRSKVAHKLLLSLVERCFAAIPYALGVIATATETGVSDFLRSAAFIMLDTIVKRHSKHDLFVATVHTHARDIKSALLIALTTTSVRRKLAIRFTIKFFKFLMAHNKPIHNLLDTNLRCALQNASDQEPKGDIKVMFSKYAAFIDNLTSSSRKPRSKT